MLVLSNKWSGFAKKVSPARGGRREQSPSDQQLPCAMRHLPQAGRGEGDDGEARLRLDIIYVYYITLNKYITHIYIYICMYVYIYIYIYSGRPSWEALLAARR